MLVCPIACVWPYHSKSFISTCHLIVIIVSTSIASSGNLFQMMTTLWEKKLHMKILIYLTLSYALWFENPLPWEKDWSLIWSMSGYDQCQTLAVWIKIPEKINKQQIIYHSNQMLCGAFVHKCLLPPTMTTSGYPWSLTYLTNLLTLSMLLIWGYLFQHSRFFRRPYHSPCIKIDPLLLHSSLMPCHTHEG